MNWSIYQSFARMPLGLAVTIEFLGPLGIALAHARRWLDAGWAVLAGIGVALLGFRGSGLTPDGVLFALLAGSMWAAYIPLSAATGRRWPGLSGLSIASTRRRGGPCGPRRGARRLDDAGAARAPRWRHGGADVVGGSLQLPSSSRSTRCRPRLRHPDEPRPRGCGAGRPGGPEEVLTSAEWIAVGASSSPASASPGRRIRWCRPGSVPPRESLGEGDVVPGVRASTPPSAWRRQLRTPGPRGAPGWRGWAASTTRHAGDDGPEPELSKPVEEGLVEQASAAAAPRARGQ